MEIPYNNILERLYNVNLHGGMKLDLSNIQALNKAFDYPDANLKIIHVAGTNGKGSVCKKIAKGLELQGNKVGLYISPHISSFRERITINGALITEKDVIDLLNRIFSVIDKFKIPATFFEITTMLALLQFAKEKVDYAVLETGLGGRLDATNIVMPYLTVITSIALDHTETLGDSLEKIAKEKAGILKPNVPVVLGPRASIVPVPSTTLRIDVKDAGFATYEKENCAISEAALKWLKVDNIKEALNAKLPCRMENVNFHGKNVVLDVAHNPDGLNALFNSLKARSPYHIVCGLSKTKDLHACLSIIKDHALHIYLVEAPNGRGAPKEQLAEILLVLGTSKNSISIYPSITLAIENALFASNELVICGSFFIMSEARFALGINEPRDPLDMNERKS